MAPLSSYTLVALARRLARELGAIRAEGTAASATGTVVTDTVNLVTFPANDDAIGYEFVIISGGGTGNEGVTRLITDSVGSATYTITVPTVSNMNTTTPVYMVLDPRIATYQSLVDAIRAAVESVIHLHLAVKMDATRRVNDLMMGEGDMEVWTVSTVPDGWSLGAGGEAATQESGALNTNSPHDGADYSVQYSCALAAAINDQADIVWRPYARGFEGYGGKAFKLMGRVKAAAASRARLALADSATTTWGDYHSGGNGFEELSASATLANPGIDFNAYCVVSSGAVITAYFDSVRLLSQSYNLYDYILPAGYTALSEVWIGGEDELEFNFASRVPDHLWDVFKGSTNDRIRFRPNMFLPEDCRILLIGQTDITIPSAATDNITASPEYVISFAKSQIYYRNGKTAEGDRWYGVARQQREEMSPGLLPNSKLLERL